MNFFKTTFVFLFISCPISSFAASWEQELKQAILENNVEEVKRCLPHVAFDLEDVYFYELRENLAMIRLNSDEETRILSALENLIYDENLISFEDILKSIDIESKTRNKLIILDLLLNAEPHREANAFAVIDTALFRMNKFIFQIMLMRQTDLYYLSRNDRRTEPPFIEAFEFDLNPIQTNYSIHSCEEFILLSDDVSDFLDIFLKHYKGKNLIHKFQGMSLLKLFFNRFYFHMSADHIISISHYKNVLLKILKTLGPHINERSMADQSIVDLAIEPLILWFAAVENPFQLHEAGWIFLTLEEHGADVKKTLQRISNLEHQALIRNFLEIERARRNAAAAREVEDILIDNEEQIEPEPNSWTTYFLNIVSTTLLAPFFFFHNQNS